MKWRTLLTLTTTVVVLGVLAPAQAGAMTWSKPVNVSSYSVNTMACPSTTLCVGGDQDGALISSTDPTGGSASDWKDTGTVMLGAVEDISCPSTQLCVAIDSNTDVAFSIDPGGGSASDWHEVRGVSSTRMAAVSCPSTSLCVASDSNGALYTSTDPTGTSASDWPEASGAIAPYPGLASLSCVGSAVCVGTEGSGLSPGVTVTNAPGANDPSDWTKTALDHGNGPLYVSCSPALCVLSDGNGTVLTATDPTGNSASDWTPTKIDGSNAINAISCPSASFCAAGDSAGNLLSSSDPGANVAADWASDAADLSGGGIDGIGCFSAVLCVAGDSNGDVVVGQGAAPPTSTSPPKVSGKAQEGQTLTESHGTWTESPTQFSYQWEDCDAAGTGCTAISSATAQRYKLGARDVGHTIRVQETALGASAPAVSPQTAVISGPSVPSPAAIRSMLKKLLVPHGSNGTIHSIHKHGGYTFSFSALTGGTLQISWHYLGKAGHRHGTDLVALLSARIKAAGKVKLTVALNPNGKRLFAHHSGFRLSVTGFFKPSGGHAVNVNETVTL